VKLERPTAARQLLGCGRRPEDVVDGEDLVEARLAPLEVRDVDGLEGEPPGGEVLLVSAARALDRRR
jgi:hypothetical protein